MSVDMIALWVTLAITLIYFLKQWLRPARVTRMHQKLRNDWLDSVTAYQGSEILAVQTIRNSLMSCTMTATTATIALMGGVSLLHDDLALAVSSGNAQVLQISAIGVLVLLSLSFITSMLSARQWHHAGFVAGMPTESPQRMRWLEVGQQSLRRAGHFYALAVRLLMWCIPVLLAGLIPWLGLLSALTLLAVLLKGIDR